MVKEQDIARLHTAINIYDHFIFPFTSPRWSEECHLWALTGICPPVSFSLLNSPSFLYLDADVFESYCPWAFCLPLLFDFSLQICICKSCCSGHMDKPPQFPSSCCLYRLMGPNYLNFFFSNGAVSPIHCFWYFCNPLETSEFKDVNFLFYSSCVYMGLLRTQPSSEVQPRCAWDVLVSFQILASCEIWCHGSDSIF